MAIITRKAKVVVNYLDDKPTMYKMQQITMPMIKFDDLCDEVAARSGLSKSQSKAVVTGLVESIGMYLKVGHPVSLDKLGSLSPRIRVKLAKKIDEADVETLKRFKVHFTPGALLRSAVIAGGLRQGGSHLDDEE